jgi:ABC-type sugar transport system permease subunit
MIIKKRRISLRQKKVLVGYAFLSPWIVGLLLVFIIPLASSIIFSFCTLTVDNGYVIKFTGLANYIYALTGDAKFLQYLAETMLDLLYNVPVLLVFSFFVAVLLKQKFHGNALAKFIFFIPVIMSSGLFLQLQSNFGNATTSSLDAALDNAASAVQVLKSMNLSSYLLKLGMPDKIVELLTAPVDRVYEVVTSSGIQIFIFLAALNAVPASLYEAAHVEGATGWESFWKITFPMVTPMILVNIVYSIVDTFTSVNNSVMDYVKTLAFQKFDFGLSSAMGWLYCLMLSVVLVITFWYFSRRTFYYT